jgi:DNA-binding MarR family transcriptional regulator
MAGKQAAANALFKMVTLLAEEMEKEMPLTQVLMFARVALAGGAGVDQGRLEKELKLSSAGTSRTAQALSKIHYHKDRPGHDVIESTFDAKDRRLRALKLTPKGERIIAKLQQVIG